jgi:hypothetical protein
MSNKTALIYSVFSGTYYEIPEKDFPLLDMGQLPLLKRPNSCKKCYNKGNLGRDNISLTYQICSCVKKVMDMEKIRENLTDKIDINNLPM